MTVISNMNALMNISLSLPVEMFDNPVAAPVLVDYATKRGQTWRKPGQKVPRANTASADSTLYSHWATVKSVVIHERFETYAIPPNDAYRTFTFGVARGKLLSPNDLFAPGVDPLTAIPPIARPYVAEAPKSAPPAHSPDM